MRQPRRRPIKPKHVTKFANRMRHKLVHWANKKHSDSALRNRGKQPATSFKTIPRGKQREVLCTPSCRYSQASTSGARPARDLCSRTRRQNSTYQVSFRLRGIGPSMFYLTSEPLSESAHQVAITPPPMGDREALDGFAYDVDCYDAKFLEFVDRDQSLFACFGLVFQCAV